MTPLSGDLEWIRTRRARVYRTIADRNGGKLPSGIFSRDVSMSEAEAEVQWLAEKRAHMLRETFIGDSRGLSS
jgi:hypothetical protein